MFTNAAAHAILFYMNRFKKQWLKLGAFLLAGGFYLLLYGLQVGCLFRSVTGWPCPGCGMTRAWVSLLHGDVAGMFYHHPMAPLMPVLLLYVWKDGRLLPTPRGDRWVLCCIGVGFLVTYVVRLALWKAGIPSGF